jgi:hypothetical protein
MHGMRDYCTGKKSPQQHGHECRTESFFSSFFSSFLQESMLRGRVMHPMLFLGLKKELAAAAADDDDKNVLIISSPLAETLNW